MRYLLAILFLMLLLLPVPEAMAQSQGACSHARTLGTDYGCAGPGEALTAAVAAGESQKTTYGNSGNWSWNCEKLYVPNQRRYSYHCVATGSGFTFANYQYDRYWNSGFQCPGGAEWDQVSESCPVPCDERPALTSGWLPYDYNDPASPVGTCVDGCTYVTDPQHPVLEQMRLDGSIWTSVKGWVPLNLTCSAGPDAPAPETPPTDSDGDGISDGNDSSPENPGESTSPTDPGTPPTCGGAGQPECKSSGGDKEKNTSSGGGDCNTPPTSSGDAILGQIAYQTWATRCAIAKGNGSTGAPNSTGDGKGNQAGNGDANGNGQPDWTEGGMADPADDGEDGTGHTRWGIPVNSDMLDTENIFGAGSCPSLSITVMNKTFSTSEVTWWCTLVQVMRSVVLIVGAFTALRILMGE